MRKIKRLCGLFICCCVVVTSSVTAFAAEKVYSGSVVKTKI